LNYDLEAEFNVPLLAMFKQKIKTSFNGTLPIGDMAMELPSKLKETLRQTKTVMRENDHGC